MAILKSDAELLGEQGQRLGDGMIYVHLPRGLEREQDGSGTMSLKAWTPTEDPPAALQLPDGRRLAITVSRDALSDCSRNRVLRFQVRWPGAGLGARN